MASDDAADQQERNPVRVWSLDAAISTLTGLPQFPAVDAAMRQATEAVICEMEASPVPRTAAIIWFDLHAEHYLGDRPGHSG